MEEEKKKNYFFCSYFRHISLCFYSNLDRKSSLDVELNYESNKYPLGILLTDLATLKTRNTWKNIMFFQVFCVFGVARSVKSMPSGYSLDPTSSTNQNLSKNTRRYVKNTNKKVVFFLFFLQN